MQSGLAPKARRAFAIFVAERGTAKKGDPKEAHSVELKRLGKLWKQLPDEEKATYKERSSAEFAAQRAALVRHGRLPRMPKSPKKAGSSEKAGDSQEVVAISGLTRLRSRMYAAEILSWAKGLMAKCLPQPAPMDVDVP